MPVLVSDDAVRGLRAVWYGTPEFRWPWYARYVAWGTAVAIVPVAWFWLWLLIPVGVTVVGVAWSVGVGRRRDLNGWLTTVSAAALAALTMSWQTLVRPFPWWAAVPMAIAVAVLITRQVMRLVDFETPLRYWRTVLVTEVRTPRWRFPRSVALRSPRGR